MTTETTEHDSGLDRRALIKKGLVLGGAAAVLPVISTFDTPAFAASAPPPGFRVQIDLTFVVVGGVIISLGSTRVASGATACPGIQAAWTAAAGDAPPTTVVTTTFVTTGLLTAELIFTIPTAGHHFLEGNRASGCQAGTVGTGPNNNVIVFALSTLDLGLSDTAFLIVT
jgi:hypothetical protein